MLFDLMLEALNLIRANLPSDVLKDIVMASTTSLSIVKIVTIVKDYYNSYIERKNRKAYIKELNSKKE